MEGDIIGRAPEERREVLCEDVFPCCFRAGKQKILPAKQSCYCLFPDLFSVIDIAGASGCNIILRRITPAEFPDPLLKWFQLCLLLLKNLSYVKPSLINHDDIIP